MRGVKGHGLRLTYLEMLQVTQSGLETEPAKDRASKGTKSLTLGKVTECSEGW